MSNQIALISPNSGSGSGNNVIFPDGSRGTILDLCQECYDPEKSSPCGEDTTMTVSQTITEKTGPFESSLVLTAKNHNNPNTAVISSDVTTWTIFKPHGLPNQTSVGQSNQQLLDLVHNPLTANQGIKSVKVVKNSNFYRFNITFFNLSDFNTFQNALVSTGATTFFSIYKAIDVHLWRAAMYNYQGDDTTLSYWIDYDITQNPTNVNQKFWHLYTVLRLKDLTFLNNGFAQANNIAIKYATNGLPIEKVKVERVITFNNTCLPKTLTKTIELESVTINPKPLQAGLVNQFAGLLLTFKTR